MRKTAVVALLAAGALLVAVLLLVAAILLLLVFCLPAEVDRSDMVGTYVGTYEGFPKITARHRAGIYKGGTHLLELKGDGRYTYVYDPIEGNGVQIVGSWKFGRGYSGPCVRLDNFLLAPSALSCKNPGCREFPVQKKLGGPIRLAVDYDLAYYFVKKTKPDEARSKGRGVGETG